MRYADFIYGDAPELRPLLDHCAAFLSAARANASGSNGSRSTGNHSRGSNSTTTTTHASGGRGSDGRVRVEHVDGGDGLCVEGAAEGRDDLLHAVVGVAGWVEERRDDVHRARLLLPSCVAAEFRRRRHAECTRLGAQDGWAHVRWSGVGQGAAGACV